jgi:arylsulfatase A-like enzyme
MLREQGGQCTRNYMLAMLAALDDSVGRVVAAWKAAGLYDNSVIVFQSDK